MTCSNKSVYTKENYETKISSTQSSSEMEIEFICAELTKNLQQLMPKLIWWTTKEPAPTNAKSQLILLQTNQHTYERMIPMQRLVIHVWL